MNSCVVKNSREQNSEILMGDSAMQSSPCLTSEELFRSGNTVRIEHAGQTYWLRLTRGNKLILTK
ncbi:MAG TPA: hemin uptake protein HemP [Spongiibacteraceae bacterium]|nr:hemin uptake protein HemP [Spongiibacteraceae bacterium]